MKTNCVVCLFKKGKKKPADTICKGYAVCEKHLSFDQDFFRDWESVQDPKHQPHPDVTATAMSDTGTLPPPPD